MDLRGDVSAETFTELVEVGVDLPGTACGEHDEAETGSDHLHDLAYGRLGHHLACHSSRSRYAITATGSPQYRENLVNRGLQIVIDHKVIESRFCVLDLLRGNGEAPFHVFFRGVAPFPQPTLQLLGRRWQDE